MGLAYVFPRFLLILTANIFAFSGIVYSQTVDDRIGQIKIGLLIPDAKSTAALRGAELAIRSANRDGGIHGKKFELVVRSMEGPWGTGSREAISLIFDEKVWALLGSHDGRNAHLAEQASAKAHVVLMSAWTGDPTLAQAYIPWFFNCVPDNSQQAEALAEEIYHKRHYSRVAIIYDDDYDSKQAFDNFLKKAPSEGNSAPVKILFKTGSSDLNGITNSIRNINPDCLILFCRPAASYTVFSHVRLMKTGIPVFGHLYILNEDELSSRELQAFNGDLLVPSGKCEEAKSSAFREEYTKFYGVSPGLVASYSFDCMNLLIQAIREAGGNDREKIQKAMESINYEGVTGPIKFDVHGKRSGPFYVMNIKNGIPTEIK